MIAHLDKAVISCFLPYMSMLRALSDRRLTTEQHGKMALWQNTIATLPEQVPQKITLGDTVSIGEDADISPQQQQQLRQQLMQFHPWRKGPYTVFGLTIDTEWRSDWKWQRILPHISSLAGRKVLDVGGGNGYHGWRMLEQKAAQVITIDPTRLFAMQFHIMQCYIQSPAHVFFALGLEAMPENMRYFDSVFSMGVLYHRRSPLDHLLALKSCLRPEGELVLETLVVNGPKGHSLIPDKRYAKMRNVWFIPTVATLTQWLERVGFYDVRCVDIQQTTVAEQRRTQWMQFESLADFLDPCDHHLTIEGHPAPTRAVMIATAR